MRTPHPEKRTGFTLVEMLVVIAIIGVLVALLVPAVMSAIETAKNGAITLEVDRLAQSFEAYHLANGDYPPDFTNHDAVVAHVRRAYPRNTTNIAAWLSNTALTPLPGSIDPAEALVLWLGRVTTDPRDPLGISGSAGQPKVYFEFDETRLVDLDGDGWLEYTSKQSPEAPYVYFDGRIQTALDTSDGTNKATCAYAWAVYPMPLPSSANYRAGLSRQRDVSRAAIAGSAPAVGVVRPYRSSAIAEDTTTWPTGVGQWMGHKKFQIICAGLDGNFGADVSDKTYPDPNYTLQDEDEDNLASFSTGRTIRDSVP